MLSSPAPALVVVDQSEVKGAELEEAELEEGEKQKTKQVGGQRLPMIVPCWSLEPWQLHPSSPPSGSRVFAAPQVLSAEIGHRSDN